MAAMTTSADSTWFGITGCDSNALDNIWGQNCINQLINKAPSCEIAGSSAYDCCTSGYNFMSAEAACLLSYTQCAGLTSILSDASYGLSVCTSSWWTDTLFSDATATGGYTATQVASPAGSPTSGADVTGTVVGGLSTSKATAASKSSSAGATASASASAKSGAGRVTGRDSLKMSFGFALVALIGVSVAGF